MSLPFIDRAPSALPVQFVSAPHRVARLADHELWMAFLRDPDANVLALMSERPLTAEGAPS